MSKYDKGEQLIDLFDIKDFMPHGYCLSWSPVLLWLHVISDLLITLAYYSIPLILIYFIRQRKDWPYPWLAAMCAGFIVACGTTHLLSAITIWIPLYWLDGLVKGFTAIVSVATAVLMLWIIPRALSLPSTAQLQAEIQQRKTAEEALQKSQIVLQEAQRIAHVGSWQLDVTTHDVVWSEELYRILGLNPELPPPACAGYHQLFTPQSWEQLNATLTHAKKTGGPYELELEIIRADGTHGWILARGEAIRGDRGSIIGLHGVALDITERKQIEAKLNAIFNASVEGIITYDTSDIIVSVNAAVETIFGYKPEELVGHNICKFMPSSPNCNLSGIAKSIDRIREVEGIHKNGSIVPLDLSVAEFSIDNARYFTNIVRDVSLRKHREQQDKEHLDELAHVTRLGLMGEMASGIAHEVNQPLAAISSYTQVSLNLINNEDPDLIKLTEILQKTQQQSLRAGRIIHRMREFVKSHAQHRSTVDVNTLVHEAVGLCASELKQNDIKLKLELENNLPFIYVDQIQIEQVIINLIRNSVDALRALPAKQQRQLLIHSQLTHNKDIQIWVKDNGEGLNEDQQQKILTPFYTTKSNGMGMGLSISRSLVEAHEGTLHFNSKAGKGTTFYFTLPITATT